jgi:hypothetical protein
MYLAGYSLECLLKAKLMQRFRCRTLEALEDELHERSLLRRDRSVFTHQLEPMVQLLGAKDRLKDNDQVYAAFNLANRWLPSWRYSADPASDGEAELFLDSTKAVRSWVANNV